jgi:hypothetical protein
MSHEGVTLIMRAALILPLVVIGACVRAWIGPSQRRGDIMLVGTLGGVSGGIFVAYLLSTWFHVERSVVSAVIGMMLGWAVAWRFARSIPREAP